MSKCKIVLSGADSGFVGKLARLIHNAFTSGDSPIAALETESGQPGVIIMTAEPFVGATCEAGEAGVSAIEEAYASIGSEPFELLPLPAQVGHFHSPEAIALAGLVLQHAHATGDTVSRAYKLADKILTESTGVTRG